MVIRDRKQQDRLISRNPVRLGLAPLRKPMCRKRLVGQMAFRRA
jgi:hypothetical protein